MSRQTHKERYGYPLWMVWAAVLGILAVPIGIIVAFATGDWEWIGASALAALIIWSSTRA
jgi:hypothetical protein